MSVKKRTHDEKAVEETYKFKGWRLRLLRLLALLVIVCVGLSACGKKKSETKDEEPVVKIGVLLDFSGEKASESEQLYSAASIAVDEINAAGGVLTDGYMLELIKMDDAGDYMNSVAGYYKLVEDGVCAVIGTNNSKGMKELITASSSANVPVITPSITDDSLVSAANFVYQACFSDKYAMQAMAKLLSTKQNKTQGSQSVALVCPTEDERYISLYEDMAAAVNSYNLDTVYAGELSEYTVEELEKIFDSIVAAKAENLFIPAAYDNLDMILSVAEKKGYDGVFIGLPEWNEYAGDTYGYDIYIPVNMAVDKDNEAVKSFAGKLGDVTSDGVRPAYEAVYFIRGAIESGHLATAASIALKLPFLEGSTSLGDYSIGAYGNIDKAVDIVLMCDGEKSYMTTIFE